MEKQKEQVVEQEPKAPEPVAEMEEVEKFRAELKEELSKVVPEGKLEAWKETFGPVQVLYVRGEPYIFRGMSRLEWREVIATPATNPVEELMKEDQVVGKCLLYPENPDLNGPAKAGLGTVLFAAIQRLSSFEPDLPPVAL